MSGSHVSSHIPLVRLIDQGDFSLTVPFHELSVMRSPVAFKDSEVTGSGQGKNPSHQCARGEPCSTDPT